MKEQQAGWSVLLSGRNGLLAFTLTGALGLHALNLYMVSTTLPQIMASLEGRQYYAWTESIFFIATLMGAALVNKTLARFGLSHAYLAACLLFAMATFACGLAPSMPLFLLARLVQGFASGLLASLTYSMVRLVYEQILWPRAMALIAGSWGVATLIGPALGGIFAHAGHWRMAFFCVGGMSALLAFISLAVLPRQTEGKTSASPLPWKQLFLLIVMILVISIGSVLDPARYGLAIDPIWVKLAAVLAGLLLLWLLGYIDKHAQCRILPQGAFSARSVLFSLYSLIILLCFPGIVVDTFLTLFLQDLHGLSPILAGYLAVLVSLGWTAGALASAGVSRRRLARLFVLMPVLSFAGLGVLVFIIPAGGASFWFLAAAAAALLAVGLGSGIIWPHILAQVLHYAPEEDADLASASLTQVQLFASALGAALAGVIANLAGLHHPGGETGLRHSATALFVFLILAIVATIPAAWRMIRVMREDQDFLSSRQEMIKSKNPPSAKAAATHPVDAKP